MRELTKEEVNSVNGGSFGTEDLLFVAGAFSVMLLFECFRQLSM